MQIAELAEALNHASSDFEIGELQDMRVRLTSLDRPPCRGIFSKQTIHDDYAFHLGGRTELQFNIGKEKKDGVEMIRHGVAFSLEPSRTLPTIDPLRPKIARFNDYVRTHPEDFPGFWMWHYRGQSRSEDNLVSPISDEMIAPGTFIMLGRAVKADEVDVPSILADFDLLIPLYVFVESGGRAVTFSEGLPFTPGCPRFAESTSVTFPGRTNDVSLRHKQLQRMLYHLLCLEAGADNVAVEHSLNLGVRVDVVVRTNSRMTFYEVKVAPTVQSCLRPALGQLLEYACWPSADRAGELVVVGESEVDRDSAAYLRLLRDRFALPLWYRRIDTEHNALGERS